MKKQFHAAALAALMAMPIVAAEKRTLPKDLPAFQSARREAVHAR
jgi:phosphoribosylcarboxyaminoimidazole (NCAIR) mutase